MATITANVQPVSFHRTRFAESNEAITGLFTGAKPYHNIKTNKDYWHLHISTDAGHVIVNTGSMEFYPEMDIIAGETVATFYWEDTPQGSRLRIVPV